MEVGAAHVLYQARNQKSILGGGAAFKGLGAPPEANGDRFEGRVQGTQKILFFCKNNLIFLFNLIKINVFKT